jgi:uncharacterized membrane protein YgdD (TMEM256/DUF423 family)
MHRHAVKRLVNAVQVMVVSSPPGKAYGKAPDGPVEGSNMAWDRRLWIRLAALSGLVSVAAGAFAAHGVADPVAKDLLRTGATYQALHALAVLAVAALFQAPARRAGWPPALFLLGTLLFSGSLYAMALGGPRWIGAVTPLGGLLFMAGWAMLAWAAGELRG